MINNSCQDCKDKQKRYQILKTDLEFQIKRIRQDLAQEKVMLQLQFQRQIKKTFEKYQKERQQRQDQNKDWIKKYDKLVTTHETQIKSNQQKHQLQISYLKQLLQSKYETCQLEKLALFKEKIQCMTKNHYDEISSLKEKQKLELIQIKSKHEQTINDITAIHHQKINVITYDYEEKVKKLKKDIDLMIKQKQNLSKQAQKKQTALYHQLYLCKQEITNLKDLIKQLNITIKNLQEEIKLTKLQIQSLKEKHQKQVKNLQKQYQSEKSSIIQDFKCKIEELLLKKLEDCVIFEQNVKQIQVKRQNQLKIYQTYIHEVKQLVQERPSKNQDLQQIAILKDLLNKRQKQIQKATEQAKNYRLQLDYKDETFNRIFKSNMYPLNTQKIDKKKEFKLSRGSAICRQNIKYNSIITMQAINTPLYETRKDRSTEAKSNKMF